MTPPARSHGLTLPFALLAMALPLSCGGGSVGTPTVPAPSPVSAKLQRVADCQALDAYLTDLGVELFARSWLQGGDGGGVVPLPGGLPTDGETPPGDGGGAGPAAPRNEHTSTNVQEPGVDEPDRVKTDGETIYTIAGSTLHVIDAWPASEAKELARVELSGWGRSLFLLGDTVVALTTIGAGGLDRGGPGSPPPLPPEPTVAGSEPPAGPVETWLAVRATILDVTDPARPQVVRTVDIEGDLIAARRIGAVVYLVTSHVADLGAWNYEAALADLRLPEAWRMRESERRAQVDTIRARVRPVIADFVAREGRSRLLPDVRVDDGQRTDLLDCGALLRPERPTDYTVLSVVALDPASDRPPTGVGVLADGYLAYASPDALYVVQDSRWWWWPENDLRYAETHVHQFGLGGGTPQYLASGKVPGWTLNEFSLSEHEGRLRVATTDLTFDAWRWGPGPGVVGPPTPVTTPPSAARLAAAEAPPRDASNVFVLERRADELDLVGALRGIAPDEQIQAVRFLGERGYVVTYQQVDPLFALDLSDPTAPRIVGELHLTGFSTYLHPMGDDFLIGIGRDGTESGQVLGLQLQLFDVSDPANPARRAQEVLDTPGSGWSWSEAEHDHHAFTFDAAHGRLAIPVTLEDYGPLREDYRFFSGIVVYDVHPETGFTELGRVSHTGFVREEHCGPLPRTDPAIDSECDRFAYPWYAHMSRSLFIEDYLYAFSELGITVSALGALDEPVATIGLR